MKRSALIPTHDVIPLNENRLPHHTAEVKRREKSFPRRVLCLWAVSLINYSLLSPIHPADHETKQHIDHMCAGSAGSVSKRLLRAVLCSVGYSLTLLASELEAWRHARAGNCFNRFRKSWSGFSGIFVLLLMRHGKNKMSPKKQLNT